jgi:hypothetical protein
MILKVLSNTRKCLQDGNVVFLQDVSVADTRELQ